MFLVTFQSVTVTNVVRDVMLLLSLFREVTTTCYGFTGKERRLSTKVRVPEKKNKYDKDDIIIISRYYVRFSLLPNTFCYSFACNESLQHPNS